MKAQSRQTTIFEAVLIQNHQIKQENKRLKKALTRLNKEKGRL